MRPNKKLIIPRRNAASINKARRNKAKAYMDEAPTLGNLYNAFINWFNSVPSLERRQLRELNRFIKTL